jgi:hypothetical protein
MVFMNPMTMPPTLGSPFAVVSVGREMCGNWAAVTLQVPEWHRVLSFIGPSLIGTDKAHFLATIEQYVPAEEHVMVGNDHSLRAYASPDDRGAADAAGWRFLSEDAFAAGGR